MANAQRISMRIETFIYVHVIYLCYVDTYVVILGAAI